MVAILFFREGFFGDKEFSWNGLFGLAKKVMRKLGAKGFCREKKGENAE